MTPFVSSDLTLWLGCQKKHPICKKVVSSQRQILLQTGRHAEVFGVPSNSEDSMETFRTRLAQIAWKIADSIVVCVQESDSLTVNVLFTCWFY